jgi:hypothetical protein
MRLHRHVCIAVGVACLAVAMGWAQDRITEEDVVTILNGKPRVPAPGQPLGIALHVDFPPQTAGATEGKRAVSGGSPQPDEALYTTLMPLARAVEAEVFQGSRFLMKVMPKSPLPSAVAHSIGQQLADRIADFLTRYFAIPRDRFSLQISLPESTGTGSAMPAPGALRWRLEVFRLE